jgi:predicted PurR-regulated permease PerM
LPASRIRSLRHPDVLATRPEAAAPAPHELARGARGWAVHAAVALALLLLLKLSAALVAPLVGALVLFLLLSPLAEALQRRGVPATVAAALLVFAPALGLGLLGFAFAPAALAWWRDIGATVARLAEQLRPGDAAGGLAAAALRGLLAQIPASDAAAAARAGREALPAALAGAMLLMLVFFLLLAQRSLLARLLRALPQRRAQVRVTAALREARDGVANYLAAMALVNLGLSVATGAVLAALGLPGVVVWAGVIFALLFIPYLGPLAITLLLAAAAEGRGAVALLAPGAFLLLHAVEAHFISPLVVGRFLRLGRPALVAAVLAGSWAWGLAGGALAVPVLIALRAGLRRAGRPVAIALLAGEEAAPPALAQSAAGALAARGAGRRVRGMPMGVESRNPCESPSSQRPIPPKSTASR